MEEPKKDKTGKMVTAIGAGLVGAAVGAGAVLLANKDNREKLNKAVATAKKTGEKTMERAQERMNDVKEKAEKNLKKAGIKK